MSTRPRNLICVIVLFASVAQAQERVYWTSEDGAVRRMTVGAPAVDVLVSGLPAPSAIKVDRCSNRMFWVDWNAEKRYEANLTGSNLVDMTTIYNPNELAIDPVEQVVYWMEWIFGGNLERAEYYAHGSDRLSADWEHGTAYGGVAINIVEGKIYGLGLGCTAQNVCNGYIWKSTLRGGGPEMVLALEVNSAPAHIAVDPFVEKLYWSEWTTKRIRRANLDGTQLETLTTTNATAWLAVDPAGGKIYWSDGNVIMRANLDFSGVEPLIVGLPSAVTGLDVEGTPLDLNSNGIDDGCEMSMPPAPTPEPGAVAKPRFVSFHVPGGRDTALRVRLVSLHHVDPPYSGGPSVPFSAFEGEIRWVAAPLPFPDSSTSQGQFYAARFRCDPQYLDWSSTSVLHVNDSAITPSSTYEVENVSSLCMGIESTCTAISAPLVLHTARWGDVQSLFSPESGTVQPDITDVSAIVDKFRNTFGALSKVRVLLAGFAGDPAGEMGPSELQQDLSFSHISACVDAFRGMPYPYIVEGCP